MELLEKVLGEVQQAVQVRKGLPMDVRILLMQPAAYFWVPEAAEAAEAAEAEMVMTIMAEAEARVQQEGQGGELSISMPIRLQTVEP